jgi:hypothetical protein
MIHINSAIVSLLAVGCWLLAVGSRLERIERALHGLVATAPLKKRRVLGSSDGRLKGRNLGGIVDELLLGLTTAASEEQTFALAYLNDRT